MTTNQVESYPKNPKAIAMNTPLSPILEQKVKIAARD